jgi:hypothetical protein
MRHPLRLVIAVVTLAALQQCTDSDIVPTSKGPNSTINSTISNRVNTNRAFTITASVYESFEIGLGTVSATNIMVTWGDGDVTPYLLTSSYHSIAHTYDNSGSYPVTITGDVRNITFFNSYYGNGQFTSVNFKALTNLRYVEIGLTPTPASLDLSHNRKLERISLGDLQELGALALPNTHNISRIEIYGRCLLDTQDMDAIIDNIYQNARAKKIRDGIFYLSSRWEDETTEEFMVGPPSPSGILKLKKLRDIYGWEIIPALN